MADVDWEALGRRAVACKAWRWMPGMLALDLRRQGGPCEVRVYWTSLRASIDTIHNGGNRWPIPLTKDSAERRGMEDVWPGEPPYAIPMLRDAATCGCLLALVREAWSRPALYAEPEDDDARLWTVRCRPDPGYGDFAGDVVATSEAEALIAALEAAP